jgi:hypothetical protein
MSAEPLDQHQLHFGDTFGQAGAESPQLLPYLSGVPAAGRSLDQHQLDLRLLAHRGGESQL